MKKTIRYISIFLVFIFTQVGSYLITGTYSDLTGKSRFVVFPLLGLIFFSEIMMLWDIINDLVKKSKKWKKHKKKVAEKGHLFYINSFLLYLIYEHAINNTVIRTLKITYIGFIEAFDITFLTSAKVYILKYFNTSTFVDNSLKTFKI